MKIDLVKLASLSKKAQAVGNVGTYMEDGLSKMRAIAGGGPKPAALMSAESTGPIPLAPPSASAMWEHISGKKPAAPASLKPRAKKEVIASYLGVIEKFASRRCAELEKIALFAIERT